MPTDNPGVPDMSDEEMAEWGAKEARLRNDELGSVNSPESLKHVQAECERRRKAAGLSRGEAVFWVTVGQAVNRGESARNATQRLRAR